MDNDHGITDELREWAKALSLWWYDPVKDEYTYTTSTMPPSIDAIRLDEHILAIADSIDAEHEKALGSKVARAISVGEDGTEFVSMPAKELSERYMELPKDADGEVIHVGDELRDGWHEQKQGEVEWLMLNNHGWWLMLKNNCERFYAHDFHEWHHHHEPTVEDVLHELVDEWVMASSTEDEEAAIAEYAKKLQLRGDEQ